jgi:lysophospholipase L1-like esterase
MVHSRPESTAAPARSFIALLHIQTSMTRMHFVGKALQGLCLLLATSLMLLPAAAQAQSSAPDTATDTRKWYLAEGAFNQVFDEDILVGNPNAAAVKVRITLLPANASNAPVALPDYTMPALSRLTVNLKTTTQSLPNFQPGAYSATVECVEGCPSPTEGIVVERTMITMGRGAHTSQGLTTLAKDWFLAEGATGFFKTYVLLANPNAQTANVVLTYLRDGNQPPVVQHVTMAPNTRRTIFVNIGVCDQLTPNDVECPEEGRFARGQAFSTKVVSDVDIAVERAMYWNGDTAAHESAAVASPDRNWLFAEGVTGGGSTGWSTFFLLVNPGATDATFTLSFLLDNQAPLVCEGTAPAGLRLTIDAANDPAQLVTLPAPGNPVKLHAAGNAAAPCDPGHRLASALFASKITSTEPIVVERTVYFSAGGIFWVDGHNTPGVTAPSARWVFAEGTEGRLTPTDTLFYESYFLISNPNTVPLNLKATFVLEDGRGLVWTGTVPAQQRYTIPAGSYPELLGHKFAAFIEAQTPTDPTQMFVAERTMYWGNPFYAGTGATGTPWSGPIGALQPAFVLDYTPTFTGLEPNTGSTAGGTDVTIHGGNFRNGITRVQFGGVESPSVRVVDNDLLVATAPAHAAGAVDVTIINSSTAPPGTTSNWPSWTKVAPGAFTYVSPEVAPHLSVKFALAFGDSITWGVTSRVCTIDTLIVTCSYDIVGYPKRVSDILNARYPSAPIVVENAGVPGECVSMTCIGGQSGRNRFQNRASEAHDLVVLLEGVNDLNSGRSVSQIIDALRTIIQTAKAANKQIVIMTLPPGKPKDTDGSWKAPDPEDVAALNAAIETLKTQEAIPRVDLIAAFGDNYRQYLSPDGLHPTDAGYQRIANAVANKIIEVYETTRP